jgi:hypothetical protein
MAISNHRTHLDAVYLKDNYWSGMKQGKDGYPKKNKDGVFLIAGGD